MAVEFKDYYETLGVSRDASDDDIRKSYRKLARKYHPDVAEDKVEGERKFKELNEAYEVLGDAENRKKYDALGANWKHGADFRPPPGAGGFGGGYGGGEPGGGFEYHFDGTGFSDFFEQIFGRAGRGGGFGGFAGGAQGPMGGGYASRGRDVETDIMVTLDEVCHGSTRTLRLRSAPGTSGGESSVRTGRLRIPVGVEEGQLLRLAGMGDPGMGGGEPGDLFLRVRIERHPDFRVRGSDLYYDLELAPWEAVLGAKVPIRTFKGKVNLTIPPGTASGEELRMKGLGLPGGEGSQGDLHAVISISVPRELTPGERELWESLRTDSTFKPGGRHE